MSRDFWRRKRVFLTGHTGFKGSWLAVWLQALGAEVVGYSLGRPSEPSLYDLAAVGEQLVSIEADVRDFAALGEAISDYRPEIVFHLAAQSLVRRSLREPVGTFATNVMGTVHLFEAVRAVEEVRVVVNVTSDKCYENRESLLGYREDDRLGGRDPYSASKACAELVTSAYRASFENGAAIASARAGNVIGGGDWAEDRLIADVMRAALGGRPAPIRNPDAVRPWQHVLNPLAGYLALAEALWHDDAYATAWNFGPDDADARSVRWVVERLSALWPEEIPYELDAGAHPPETGTLKVDSSAARTRLGWSPAWDLERGIVATVDWYSAYRAGEDVRRVVLDQIGAYEAAVSSPTPAA